MAKDRICDQKKSIGLRLRIVVLLQESKPGYRGGLGTKLLSCLQQLYTLVKEKLLSTLGSWICPIEWTPVIIQVVSQLLPSVTPEKIYIEDSPFLGLDQYTCSYTLKCLWTVLLHIPVIHLWLASFFNLLT